MTAPLLAPGYVLQLDMVFVPRQHLDLDALGLSGSLPRAVPADAVMALLTALVPGWFVQKAVLVATVYAAVLGAARLAPRDDDGRPGLAAPVAGLVYGWSPYLAERLLLGHWSLLVAWGALPWVARAALRARSGDRGTTARLVLAMAPAALTPTGALLATGTAVAAVGLRRAPVALAAGAVLSLPWVVAGVLSPAGGGSDPAGVAAFAARPENWGGTVLSVLGTGGVWSGGAVPASRTSVLAPAVTVALLALTALGAAALRRRPAALRLGALGLLGVVLALLGAWSPTAAVLERVVEAVPGGGLLRDGQKWVAWAALPLAVGAGVGSRRLVAVVRERVGAAPAAVLAAAALLLPVVAVPDLAWGVGGRLQPVAWPAAWAQVSDVLADETAPGDVLVLPAGAYRGFAWNDRRPQLDPAARWLTRPVLSDDTLVVGDRAVRGEDARVARVLADAGDAAALARDGVGWVLVERGTPGPVVPAEIARLPLVVDTPDLRLYRVPGAEQGPRPGGGRAVAVVAAHAVALGTVGWSVLWIVITASTVPLRRRPSKERETE